MSKEVFELDYENDFKPTKPMNNLMTAAATSPIVAVPVPVPVADSKDKDKEKSKVSKRPKPMLSLQLSDADSALQSGLLPPQTGIHTYSIYQHTHIHTHIYIHKCINA